MDDITITVTDGKKTLSITNSWEIGLTPDKHNWYNWKKVFETILSWLSWDEEAINDLMPDCEECHKCEDCEYIMDKEPPLITEAEGYDRVISCLTCYYGRNVNIICDVCKNYSLWMPVSANAETTGKDETIL